MKKDKVKYYPADLPVRLEYDKIKDLLYKQCKGKPGQVLVDDMFPVYQKDFIETALDETVEFLNGIMASDAIPLQNYQPIDENIRRLNIQNYVLTAEKFIVIRQLLVNTRAILNYFNTERKLTYKNLYLRASMVEWKGELLASIDKVFDEEGEVKSNASEELSRIRKLIRSKIGEQDRLFGQLLQKFRQSGWLTDNAESIRNGRRVLSVPAEHKRKISGITHDESSTGRTVYIEPDGVIQINNDIASLYIEEKKEVYKILQQLSALFVSEVDYLDGCEALVAHMDFTAAKAQLAMTMKAHKPELVDKPHMKLMKAYHPLLLLKNENQGKETIPFSLDLHSPNRILLLSGPNAGGKSVTMKATGLLQIMVQSGMLIPAAEYSEVGVFNSFFTDIGDQQSLEEDLSTYSSHLHNMKFVTEHADECSLLLFDEFGSGTDPKMGGAIAESILKAINKKKAWGVITTHYSNLKIFAFNNKGIVNGAMTFDKETLSPTYHMNIGKPGSSFAFEIASKSGLSDRILSYARKRAGEKENEVDELLVELQNERAELKDKLDELKHKEKALERLSSNYEQAQKDLEHRRKRLKMEIKEAALQQVNKENEELKQLIRELKSKDSVIEAQKAMQKRKRQRKEISTEVESLREEVYYKDIKDKKVDIQAGTYVRMVSGTTVGKVESVDRKSAMVIFGDLRMQAKIRDLVPVEEPLELKKNKSVTFDTVQSNATFEPKIDIRGFRKDEAVRRVQEFMDQAALSSAQQLEILHGKGDGILKRTVKEKVREYSFVKGMRHPSAEAGGDGITIIELA